MHDEVYSPIPPSERGQWLVAIALCLLGAGILVAVVSGAVGSSSSKPLATPPAVLVAAATPTAASASETALLGGRGTAAGPYAPTAGRRGATRHGGTLGDGRSAESSTAGRTARTVASVGVVLASPLGPQRGDDMGSLTGQSEVHISAAWEAGFYPIYAEAQHVFGVNVAARQRSPVAPHTPYSVEVGTSRSEVRRERRAWHSVLAVRRRARASGSRPAPAADRAPGAGSSPARCVAALHPARPRRTAEGGPRRSCTRGARHRAVVRDIGRATAPTQQKPPGIPGRPQLPLADRQRVASAYPCAQRSRDRVRQGSTGPRR
jgi:hypothetical protein